jgi:biofilm PGA synthesis N-glycosyltransferase PgaC
MSAAFVSFAIFWGVWLLVPALVDGISTLFSLIGFFLYRMRQVSIGKPLTYHPVVSIIIPVYNGEQTLAACLESIAAQTYPLDKMEILIIDNGSTDGSLQVFRDLQPRLKLNMGWHSIVGHGKAWALNAGIHLTSGQYILGVDCDVVLEEGAVTAIIQRMEADKKLGAVTANLVILPAPDSSSAGKRLLANCEFLEYATVFGVGRAYQSFARSIFTLSGACTAFRRDALLATYLYNNATVSEDTDMTFQLYEKAVKYRIAIVPQAKVFLHPIGSLAALYGQRVRWQRGQLEVTARHEQIRRRSILRPFGFSPLRTLLVDHTLAFPRFVWMFFMPVLLLFGYSPDMIFSAYLITYVFYLFIELLWYLTALLYADREIRQRIRGNLPVLLLMPFFRVLVFFFRFSGFLYAISEKGTWGVSDPIGQVRMGLGEVGAQGRQLLQRIFPPRHPRGD